MNRYTPTGKYAPAPERFWRKVSINLSGCWTWTAGVGSTGYGKFGVAHGNPPQYAHRYSYELNVGSIPDGMVIDHLCENKLCVRPDHLQPVTSAINTRRSLKTECPRGHAYVDSNLYISPDGRRFCHTCIRLRTKGLHR